MPVAVGFLLTGLAANLHIVIDPNSEAQLVALMAAVLSAAYYTAARFLERKWPVLTWLLGSPVQPASVTEGKPSA